MKYMEKGGFKHNPLMRLTLSLTLMFLFFFWLTNFAMYFAHMNLNPQSVVAYYRGSDATFQVPKTFEGLSETSHFHLPIMALVILMLTHLMIFVPVSKPLKVFVIVLAFASAFLQEASSWLVRFGHPAWAWLKVFSFVCLQSVLGFLMLALLAYLWFWDRYNWQIKDRPEA